MGPGPLLNVLLSGVAKRGPEAKNQTLPSVSPSGWQLAHDIQPWSDISPSLTPFLGTIGPIEVLNSSLPR